MDDQYQLEKAVWTSRDFEVMGWHDSRVWAMVAAEENYEFAMVFENAHEISIKIESSQGGIEVADLHREQPKPMSNGDLTEHLYRFECQEGTISLRATGYCLYVRMEPRLMRRQCFSLAARGGISVERCAVAT